MSQKLTRLEVQVLRDCKDTAQLSWAIATNLKSATTRDREQVLHKLTDKGWLTRDKTKYIATKAGCRVLDDYNSLRKRKTK